MISSFYSGVSGLKDHLAWLDVIGENLANVNTTGFKRSRVIFEDILNQNLQSAVAPRAEVGGVNPMQVGLGSAVATIQTMFSQGKFLSTGRNTDLAIDGEDSFFTLTDGISENYRYTRNGNFDFDSAGNLVNLSNGFKVLGWNAERDGVSNQLMKDPYGNAIIDVTKPLSGIKLIRGDIMPGKATSKIDFKGDLFSNQTLPVSNIDLSFKKGISSVVSVSNQIAMDIKKPWDQAGFYETPDGTITINGVDFKIGGLGGIKTPYDLMTEVNANAKANVTMQFKNNKFSLTLDTVSNNPEDNRIALSETPDIEGHGFFTQAFIKAGTKDEPYYYNTNTNIKIQFEHILDPENADRNYYRWKAVDPTTTNLVSTNAYHYVRGDILQGSGAIEPDKVVGKEIGMGDGLKKIFELFNTDVDPSSLRVSIIEQSGAVTVTKTGRQSFWGDSTVSASTYTYYFDDDSKTNYPGRKTTPPFNWPESSAPESGLDRLVFNIAPRAGAIIKVDYVGNGFSLHNAAVDPSQLQVKKNGEDIPKALYRFNNNQGVKGADQITFYSAVSDEEVVSNVLDTGKKFANAGFNWNLPVYDRAAQIIGNSLPYQLLLNSKVSFKWNGGVDEWTSPNLSAYNSVDSFLKAIKYNTDDIVDIKYDIINDRFNMTTTENVEIGQTNGCGFFTVAKLDGEGLSTFIDAFGNSSVNYTSIDAGERQSREEVVANNLNMTLSVFEAGFNNKPVALTSTLSFSWVAGLNPANADGFSWVSVTLPNMSTYDSMESFIDTVNFAKDNSGLHFLPVSLRYDPERDRFTIVNTSRSDWAVKVRQIAERPEEGFLSRAHLLTDGLASVVIPSSVIKSTDVVTADYYYNKTVEAKGILQLDKNGKVIDSFVDTETSPVRISSSKILGKGNLKLEGSWSQFDSGTIDGTITITTRNGIYHSKEINSAYYPTIQSLIQEINSSSAKVSLTYDPDKDIFTLRSTVEGDSITLEETGMKPFFSAINIATSKIVGGNNNSVMDLDIERPTAENGWKDTTGLYGTGQDYFRVNTIPNEIKEEFVGRGGKGIHGTQVFHEKVGVDPSNPLADPSFLDLINSDVDEETLTVYRLVVGAPPEKIERGSSSYQWNFLDNNGPKGRDGIKIKDSTVDDRYYVSYTRKNAFDLANADVDPETLVVKIDGTRLSPADYKFEDNRGKNGVDRIIIQSNTNINNPGTIGTGKITVDYRRVFSDSVDVFIPNGNKGAENITFIPNNPQSGTYIYPNGAPRVFMADEGTAVTTVLKNPKDDPNAKTKGYLYESPTTFYDAFGNPYQANFLFEKLSDNRWLWRVMNPIEPDKIAGYGVLAFNGNGVIDSDNSKVFESPSDPLAYGSRFKGIYFDPPDTPTPPESGGAPLPFKGAEPNKIVANFSEVVQLSSSPSARVTSQDGYKLGKIIESATTIDKTGVVIANYDNGQSQDIGQIALARFANPSGLAKLDATNFTETVNSGVAQIGKPGVDGRGVIRPGELESSNVDLTQEFSDMIIAQRAFQANARMVTTSEQMFIDIIALKRL